MTETPEETSTPEASAPESTESADTRVPEPTAVPVETAAPDEAAAAVPAAPETTPSVADAPAAQPETAAPETTPSVADAPAAQPETAAPEAPATPTPVPTPTPGPVPGPRPTPAAVPSVVHGQPTPPERVETAAPDEAAAAVPAAPETTPSVADAPAAQPETAAPETAAPETPTSPTPGPVPTPAAVASAVQEHPTPPEPVEPAAAPATDHSAWGRVDDDGTVWVRTSSGERAVGSFPGATRDGALAYFMRKFDEIEGQVALLEQRVAAGGVSPKDADTSITNLRESVTAAHGVGDLEALGARLDVLVGLVAGQRKEADAARAAARREALVLKERIVAEAESLSTSTDWKRTGDRLRGLLDEWKVAARLDRKTDDALWKRFSHARTAFDKNRRAHFAELDTQRATAAEAKEKLIAEAEELSTSTEWGPTARRYRDLMTQWKATGRARRDVEDKLWARFRAAQDTFFAARNEIASARDADLVANLKKKQALLAEAERLLPVTDARAARAALLPIHDRWEAAGHVPRNDKDAVEGRLRRVDEAVRAAEEAQWKNSNPEARARAEATVSQLRSSIESFDAEAEQATEAGQADKAAKAREAAAARREWLAEAERTLTEFS